METMHPVMGVLVNARDLAGARLRSAPAPMASDEEAELRSLRKSEAYQAAGMTNSRKQQVARGAAAKEEQDAEPADDESRALQAFLGQTGFGRKNRMAQLEREALARNKRAGAPSGPAASRPSPSPSEAPSAPAPTPAVARLEHEMEEDFVGPPRPAGPPPPDSSDEDDGPTVRPPPPASSDVFLPVAHEVQLKGHSKAISALALDTSGARLLSGGLDYEVRFWDFNGMDANLRPFKMIEPKEGHTVQSIDYSLNGDAFVVSLGSPQPKLFDRDGKFRLEFVRGDMYLSDLSNTKGHTAAVCSVWWHPSDRNKLMSGAADGTVRMWDVNKMTQQAALIKVKTARNLRGNVTAVRFSRDGALVAAAGMDGSIQIYDTAGPHHRPTAIVANAHVENTETSSLCFSTDGHTLLSRGGDHTLKVWDIRKIETPLVAVTGMQNFFTNSDVLFSPDDKLIVAGTSVKKKEGSGALVFIDKATLKPQRRLGVSEASVVRILWHPKLNQIVAGSADNNIHMYYDTDQSWHGALLCAGRAPRKPDSGDVNLTVSTVITPGAGEFEVAPKKKRALERKQAAAAHRPDVGTEKHVPNLRNTVSQHLIKNFITMDGDIKKLEDDPRSAVLRFAEKAEKEPRVFGAAYKATQPVPVFQAHPTDEEEAQHVDALAGDAQRRERARLEAERLAEKRKRM